MPELPELEVIAQKLTLQLANKQIEEVIVDEPLIIYGTTPDHFITNIEGCTLKKVNADGKFLLFFLSRGSTIVTNLMLAGRFRISTRRQVAKKKFAFAFILEGDIVLWYSDSKRMSRTYIVKDKDYTIVSGFDDRGPSPFDPELTMDAFSRRLHRHRGQIKNVLRNQRFVKGIGNAYADEILLYAGILPFCRCTTLTPTEIENLYSAIRSVLQRYREVLSKKPLEEITDKRDYLMIHGRGGGICPLCGGRISEVTANRFRTNYCQTCQH